MSTHDHAATTPVKSDAELARALNVDRSVICRLKRRGMPTASVEAACHESAYTGHYGVGVIRPVEPAGGAGRSRHVPASAESA